MNVPWGNQRAELLLRGIPLPPFGSIRDKVLRTMIQRERETVLMEQELGWVATGIFAGISRGNSSSAARFLRGELENFVNHKIFSAKFQLSRLRGQRSQVNDDLRMLERLNSYG